MPFIPQFQQKNPYNIFAVLIAHIRDIAEEFFTSCAHRNSIEISRECKETVDQFLEMNAELTNPHKFLYEGISEQCMDAITHWDYFASALHVFTLLLRLDHLCDWEQIINSAPVVEMQHFSSLNNNAQETGLLIIPRVPAISDDVMPRCRPDIDVASDKSGGRVKRGWADLWDYGMHCEFTNIDYVEEEALRFGTKHYQVCHTVVRDFFALDTKSKLRIVVSPLARDIGLDIEKREVPMDGGMQGLFRVKGIRNPGRVYSRIAAAHLRACREQADILVFPEMLADSELLGIDHEYSKMFETFAMAAEEEGLPSPFLIIGPTIWHDGKNEAHVLDGNGSRLCVQQKQNAFDLKEDEKIWKEDLLCPEPVVQVLHVPGLGRITIPICRDFLVTGYRDLLTKTLHCTLAICPSHSDGKTSFDLAAARDRAFGCYVIWANTCSAYDEAKCFPEHLGFVSSPVPMISEDFLEPNCRGACGSDTTACIFLIEISLDRERPRQAKVYPQIQEETKTV